MGRISRLVIKESKKELKGYQSKVVGYKASKKLDALVLIVEARYDSLKEVAAHLSISLATLHRWLKGYKEQGIKSYLSPERRNRASKIISPQLHQELEKRLNSPRAYFNSYKQVQQWIHDEYQIEIGYQWLWKYLRTKLQTKLKMPRRSHVNKVAGAEQEFFKNCPINSNDLEQV